MPLNLTYNTRPIPNRIFSIICIVLFFLLTSQPSFSQYSSKDSLSFVISKHRKKAKNLHSDTTYINTLIRLGGTLRFVKTDSLLSLSEEALALSKKGNYPLGISRAMNNIGDHFSDNGNTVRAITYYREALSLADSLKNIKLSTALLNDLATEYSYTGNYAKALESYLLAIDKASDISDNKMLSILNENIANLYAAQKEFEQALDFYKIVKQLNKDIGDEIFSAETMGNIASIHADMGNFDYAMYNVNQSIAIFEKKEIYDWLAYVYGVKGEIYLKQNKFKWALYWFDQSNILHENLQDERGKIDLLKGMAKAHLGLENYTVANTYALEGFEVSKKIKSLEGQMNCAEVLYELNKNKQDFERALGYHETFQKISDSLSRDENKRSLTLLKTKLNYDQQKKELIAKNEKTLAKQRNYITASIIILLILLGTTIPLYFNQKKQKKLNKLLKSKTEILKDREKELNEINKTKDKLFSIIGHDLRGPIGALQGILKLFSNGDLAKDDFIGFVPKLKTDVDHILFTLNNLLSWGHAQMNGTVTRPKINSIHKLVERNIQFLSELAAVKSIKIINQVTENAMGYFDENHIDIVIRNLISNAIKFTPENGLITIEAEENKAVWNIRVRDTGIGMDNDVMQKIFSDNSNITTYGTNNEKGTGLGLSLCKEMVLKNKGEIWVESLPKKGSTFYFTIPRVVKKYKKAS
ncbi:hypothetical protein MTsPCn5_08250 [Croceitalea sp. MTPC5]|uniref:tetratricopeptide repeat-containing sensor histidine kinase n=1 Tax=Croceitalea sp. MTPC5 TaxID=3056565 RepID=UPI002B38A7C9|nr:hypothetical protein MTsPCn5_08250 [Croceitalea sp. MTPC5]